MTVRPILRWPDRRLRSPADPVTEVTDDIRAIWDDMIDTMEAMPGWGLAAPQLGVMLRLAIVDTSEERGRAVRLANPDILQASPETIQIDESSPCLPGVSARIPRAARVTVRYLDDLGTSVERIFDGMDAVSVQHQIDHLDGKLFVDRLSRVKRDMILRRARKGA